jgi:RNA polymerase sigma-70 factor (ECF subfamily)
MSQGSRVYVAVVGNVASLELARETTDNPPSTRLADLFDQHHRRLYRLARRLTGTREEAQDLVQETFLRVARSPSAVPAGPRSEEAWLVRVLVNVCRDQWRRKSSRRRLDERYQSAVGPVATRDPEHALVAKSTVWRALQELAPRRRMAVILYELDGIAIPEIARLLGVSAITVRWHLSRGRKELAQFLTRPEESQAESKEENRT